MRTKSRSRQKPSSKATSNPLRGRAADQGAGDQARTEAAATREELTKARRQLEASKAYKAELLAMINKGTQAYTKMVPATKKRRVKWLTFCLIPRQNLSIFRDKKDETFACSRRVFRVVCCHFFECSTRG